MRFSFYTCIFLFLIFVADSYFDLLLILLLQVSSSLFDVNWYFWGMEKFKLTVIRSSFVKVLTLILIFLLIKDTDDLWLYTLIYALSFFISAVILWPLLLKEIKIIRVKWVDVSKHFKPNVILFIPVIAISIYKYMDKIMLANFSMLETGYFDNVERVLTVALSLVVAFGNVMMPRISNFAANKDNNSAKSYFYKSMTYIMFLSIGISCGLIAIANEFVPLYFGSSFKPCIMIMQSLSITAIFLSWANVVRTQYLIPFNKDKFYVYSVIFGAVVCFILNLILIPKYGAMGTVISTIITEGCVSVIQTFSIIREFEIKKLLLSSFPFILFGIIMIFTVRLTSNVDLNSVFRLVFEIAIGGGVYCILSLSYLKIKYGFWVTKV